MSDVGSALFVGIVLVVAIVLFVGFITAFPAMILIGILHGYHPETIPAIGFWQTLCWSMLLGIIGSKFHSAPVKVEK